MGKIYTKTVNGRKYRYERLSTKRVGKKVITHDKCLGPLIPVQRGKIENTSPQAQQRLRQMYEGYATLPEMTRWFKEDTGITVSERTITNYMKRHGVKRGFDTKLDMSEFQKRVHAQKRAAKTAAEKAAVEHLKILIEDGALKSAEIVKLTRNIDPVAVEALWKKHTARKKKA